MKTIIYNINQKFGGPKNGLFVADFLFSKKMGETLKGKGRLGQNNCSLSRTTDYR
jgi:hypothetical protein